MSESTTPSQKTIPEYLRLIVSPPPNSQPPVIEPEMQKELDILGLLRWLSMHVDGRFVPKERLRSCIGHAAKHLLVEGDTVLIPWEESKRHAEIFEMDDHEVSVVVMGIAEDGEDEILTFPWEDVILPWRHSDSHYP